MKGSGWVFERMMAVVRECRKYQPLCGGTNILFAYSSQSGKKEGYNQCAKHRQQMPEVGSNSCFISSRRWKEPAKAKQISG